MTTPPAAQRCTICDRALARNADHIVAAGTGLPHCRQCWQEHGLDGIRAAVHDRGSYSAAYGPAFSDAGKRSRPAPATTARPPKPPS